MDPNSIDKLLSGSIGAVTVLVFMLLAFIRGDIVAKSTYHREIRNADKWESIADRALTVNERYLRVPEEKGPVR